ncbi:hypothetical protein BJ742DRAFT_840332 [Cladochytrium replicatum]|nr:hypothetical protein BJ742DRAFT_840332 [Cladochytrium replicatum]
MESPQNQRSARPLSMVGAPSTMSSTAGGTDARSRNKRRDDAIRKKVEQELAKKTSARRSSTNAAGNSRSKTKSGTVSSLKPAPAITVLETARIVQAAQLMAAKRADAVLAINEDGQLSGILTDKDIAYRVVAEGLDVRVTTVAQVMTPNPISVYDKGNRNEALNIMVERKFRHLPVITDISDDLDGDVDDAFSERSVTSNVVGLLDITKCVFERLDDLERKVNEDQGIVQAMEVLERRGTLASEHVGQMRIQHACPDLSSVLSKIAVENGHDDLPEVGIRATVSEAARVMKDIHATAVLVLNTIEGDEKLGGIFTTKDIVLRVVAAGLNPETTSVVRVMTPHPDTVNVDSSILDALKKLHVGHYLHLPVVDGGVPAGLVDVLQLTIAMLNYLVSKDTAGETEGPMWNRFWNSTFAGSANDDQSDRHSLVSDHGPGAIAPSVVSHTYVASGYGGARSPSVQGEPHIPVLRYGGNITPATGGMVTVPEDLLSQHGGPAPSEISQFAFKMRDGRTGKVFRFGLNPDSPHALRELADIVYSKTGVRVNYAPTAMVTERVSYVDDEGDVIVIHSNHDLEEAVSLSRRLGWTKLMLYLGEPNNVEEGAGGAPAAAQSQDTSGWVVQTTTSKQVKERDLTVAKAAGNPVVDFLKEAPIAVNVAISATIVVAAIVAVNRLTR